MGFVLEIFESKSKLYHIRVKMSSSRLTVVPYVTIHVNMEPVWTRFEAIDVTNNPNITRTLNEIHPALNIAVPSRD